MKTCSKCKVEQPLDSFYKFKGAKDGLSHQCKLCKRAYDKDRYHEIGESRANQMKLWRIANKEHLAEYSKHYYQANKTSFAAYKKQYYQTNKEYFAEYGKQYMKKRRASDPVFRMVENMRSHMYKILNGTSKHAPTLELLGCTPEHYRHHIEAQFTEGMTFENYGEWHQDHIQAVSNFDLSDPEQQKICWHYTNMQPMWAIPNIRKGNKVVNEHQVNLL